MTEQPMLPPEEDPESQDIVTVPDEGSGLSQDEKTWAAVAHATIVLAVLSLGPLGPIAAFVIWLVKKDESEYVGYQALQSLVFQVAATVLNWLMWLGIGILSAIVIGLCCIPIGLLVSVAFLAYGVYGAYECSLGKDFRYFIIGDIVKPPA